MPLEPIANRVPPPTESRFTRRRLFSLTAIGAGSTILVSCAQGTSREAERGKERDAERTSVVDNLQATRTADLVDGTPDATPPSTPDE